MYLYIYNITTMRGHIPNHHISPRMDLAAYCHETPFADLCQATSFRRNLQQVGFNHTFASLISSIPKMPANAIIL